MTIITEKMNSYEEACAMLAWVNREKAAAQKIGSDLDRHHLAQGRAMRMINMVRWACSL